MNKQNKLIDIDNRMVVTIGEEEWKEDKESKGGQEYGDEKRLSGEHTMEL